MTDMVIIILFLSGAIAFIATVLAALIKLSIFPKKKDIYRHILKFGLVGEVAGFIIVYLAWLFYLSEIKKWSEPERIIALPLYTMLLGLIIGTFILWGRKERFLDRDLL